MNMNQLRVIGSRLDTNSNVAEKVLLPQLRDATSQVHHA